MLSRLTLKRGHWLAARRRLVLRPAVMLQSSKPKLVNLFHLFLLITAILLPVLISEYFYSTLR